MITKIINFTKSDEKKRLVTNFFSLTVLQMFTYFLPLLTLPYLVRVLGVEKYGLIMFAQSFIVFFNILVDFGFNLSATREVSIYRNDQEKLTEIFSSVMVVKFFLIAVSLVILSIVVFVVERFNNDIELYYLTFIFVIGQALFPIWYFQGIERMKYITIVNIISKVIFTLSIFILIHKQDDYLLVPLLNGLGFLSGGILSQYILRIKFRQSFKLPNFGNILFYFKESSHFFLSRLANEGLNSYITLLIGLHFNNSIVGYYSMIERLYKAYYILVQPLVQVLYPNMAKNRNVCFFKKIYVFTSLLFGILTLFMIFFSEFLIDFVYGFHNVILVKMFTIIFLATFFGITNAMIGYPLLGAFGYIKETNYSLVMGAFVAFFYVSVCYFFNSSIYLMIVSIIIYEFLSVFFRLYFAYDRIIKKQKGYLCKH